MGRRNWLRRRPATSTRQSSRVEVELAVCETCVPPELTVVDSLRFGTVGGVSIAREFLNIWDDLRRYYKDCSKQPEDAGLVDTGPADGNKGGKMNKTDKRKGIKKWSVARVDAPYKNVHNTESQAVCGQHATGTVQALTDVIGQDTAASSRHDQRKGSLCCSAEEERQLDITGTKERKTLLVPAATGDGQDRLASYSVAVSGDLTGPDSGVTNVADTVEERVVDQSDTTASLASTAVVPIVKVTGLLGKTPMSNRAVEGGDIRVVHAEEPKSKVADTNGKMKATKNKIKLPTSRPRKKKKIKHKPVQASTAPISATATASSTSSGRDSECVADDTTTPLCFLDRLLQKAQQQIVDQPDVQCDDQADVGCGVLHGDGPTVCFPIRSQATVCDLNNNPIVTPSYTLGLSTIIDAGEDDLSGEDVPESDKPAETVSVSPAATVTFKHPLEHEWTFWYFYPDRKRTWEENLTIIKTVSTIEDFWAVHNWIEPPSGLQCGADYSLFKAGISPDWEDMANRKGGRWVVNCGRQGVDRDWMEVIMAMVGQQCGDGQDTQVNGAVVSLRNRGDKVAVWVREVAGSDKAGDMMSMVLGRSGTFKVHKKQMW